MLEESVQLNKCCTTREVNTDVDLGTRRRESYHHLVPALEALLVCACHCPISQLQTRLESLVVGGYILIQGGWSDISGGHAVMYIVDHPKADSWVRIFAFRY